MALNNNHSWPVPLAEQELLIHPQHPSSFPFFCGVHVAQSLVFCVVFCRLLFVLLSFFLLAIIFQSFFDLRFLITPLVSSTFLMYHRLFFYYAIKTKTHSNLFKVFILKLTNYIYLAKTQYLSSSYLFYVENSNITYFLLFIWK